MDKDMIHCRGEKPFAPCVDLAITSRSIVGVCLARTDRVEDMETRTCDMIPSTIAVQFV